MAVVTDFTRQGLSNAGRALAKSAIFRKRAVGKTTSSWVRLSFDFSSQNAANTTRVLLAVFHTCQLPAVPVELRCFRSLLDFSKQDVGNLKWHFGKIELRGSTMASAVAEQFLKHACEFNAQDLGIARWASSTVAVSCVPPFGSMSMQIARAMRNFSPQNTSNATLELSMSSYRGDELMA